MPINLDRDRLIDTMKKQAAIGETDDGGLHRLALSNEDKKVRDWFRDQMEAEGLTVRIDEFGNMFGRRDGIIADAAPVLVGSHLDSQPYGGIYDGPLGVIAALECIRILNDEDVETERPIEIVNWTNEEGSRFQPAMQGSGVWAGAHDIVEEYAKTDENGTEVEEELERIGYKGNAPAEPPEKYDSYLELHIEQGPYLEEGGYEVGVVTGVVGFIWGAITFYGQANHSGSTPMQYRRDALIGAADVITQIRRIPTTIGDRTVGTTGYISASPNSINIIPGQVTFTFGFRDPDDDIVNEAFDRVLLEAEIAAKREGLEWEFEERLRVSSVDFPDRCIEAVESAATTFDYNSTGIFSGAGHDASHIADVCDAGMVFAVSEGGKSHSEDEHTSWDDCYVAANTLANAAVNLSQSTDNTDSK